MLSCCSIFCGSDEEEKKDGMMQSSSWDDCNTTEFMADMTNRERIRKLEKTINLHGIQRDSKVVQQAIGPKQNRRDSIRAREIEFISTERAKEIATSFAKSEEERKFLDETLGDNFIFSDLNPEERQILIGAMQKECVSEGALIIKQGDVGDFFYVVESGTVNFVVNDTQNVGNCTRGASFGELALLYDAPRAATCIAAGEVTLWKVDQNTFRSILAGFSRHNETKKIELLKSIPLFATLDETQLLKFSNALTEIKFKAGEVIVKKGEEGEVFYIVNSGSVKVHDIGLGDSQSMDQILGPGDWFGERALLTGEPRAANVTAVSEIVTLEAIGRATFEKVFGSLQDVIEHEMKKKFLEGLPIFAKSNLMAKEMDDLVDNLNELCYPKGQKIVEGGKTSDPKLCIIRKGKVVVYEEDGKIYNLESGDYFGARRLKNNDEEIPENETIVCEENTTCWVLTKEDIQKVLGDITRLGTDAPFVSSKRIKLITLRDLEKHRVLGQGGFGLVWLVSRNSQRAESFHNFDKKSKGKKIPYALKMVNKRQLVDSKQNKSIMREKDLLSTLDHPFILGLVSSFQDDIYLYLLMELVQGGELFNVVHAAENRGIGITDDKAKFYAACILDALGHFHERYICYRDLKPENVLIDGDGYGVVVDLGFAKVVPNKTYTMCGTPEYLAPEIITSKGHSKAVDYWSLGVLIYEMLVGVSPFFANSGGDQVTMFKNIIRGKFSFPEPDQLYGKEVNDHAKDVVEKLLTRKQTARLGNLSGGHHDIEKHNWFQSIDFNKLLRKEIAAPWVPQISDPFDTHLFEDMSHLEGAQPLGRPLSKEEQDLFEGF